MDKCDIRKRVLEKRDALTDEEILEKSRRIFEKLTALEDYQKAESILVYASFGSEVKTDDIILDALVNGKRVFCPKVTDKKNGRMCFVRITALEDLTEGYFHIREPEVTEDSEFADNLGGSLVIMPGVVFDTKGNRIGYGGGFYDRYLSEHADFKSVALCYDLQITDQEIEADEYDLPVDLVITD